MRYALPPGESALVERFVFACLALGVGAVAAILATDDARALGVAAAPLIPRSAQMTALGMLFLAYATTFALVAAGSLPAERRIRLGLAIVSVAVAAGVAPLSFFHDLPEAWQRPDVYATLSMVPPIALGFAAGFAAPARTSRWAWTGAALLWSYAVLHRIDASLTAAGALDTAGEYRAWRAIPALTLLAGLAIVAIAYARGTRRKAA